MNANGVGVARALQWLIGIAFITIGLLHTDVHFRELSVEPYALALGNIQGLELMGQAADVWKLWQGFSLMMGLCFVVIGLLNASVLLSGNRHAVALSFQFIMLLLLMMVVYSGQHYFGAFQFYGGLFGGVVQGIGIFLTMRFRNANN